MGAQGAQMAGARRGAAAPAGAAGPGIRGRLHGRQQPQQRGKQGSAPWPRPRRWVSPLWSLSRPLRRPGPAPWCWCGGRAGASLRCGACHFLGCCLCEADEVRKRRASPGSRSAPHPASWENPVRGPPPSERERRGCCCLDPHAPRQPGWPAKFLSRGPASVSLILLMLGLGRVSLWCSPFQQREEESELQAQEPG